MKPKNLGKRAESLATTYLKKKGLKILKRNLRTKLGEIDILAEDDQVIVVVEVKAKSNSRYGGAIEMITRKKQEKLLLLAREMQVRYRRESVRIDIVAIDNFLDKPKIKYYKGVIESHV